MQRIERYGVIALVLLLVTIAAVSFWDDGEGPDAKSTKQAVAAAARKKANKSPSKKAGGVRVGKNSLPATASLPNEKQAALQESSAQNGRSWSSRKSQPRRSTKKSFDTLPARTSEAEEGSLANWGFDRDESGQLFRGKAGASRSKEVEFPKTLQESRESRGTPLAGDRGKVAVQRDTPFASKGDSNERTRRNSKAPVARKEASGTYTVQPGDTLSEISQRVLGSSRRWTEIQALNGGIDPGSIGVGMVLKVPQEGARRAGASQAPKAQASKKVAASTGGGGSYTVRPGDSLSQIAQDLLGGASRWKEIVAVNPGLNPNMLIVGQRLRLPAGSTRVAMASEPAPKLSSSSQPRKRNRVK